MYRFNRQLWTVNFIMHTCKYGHWNTVHTDTLCLPDMSFPPNWKSLWPLETNKAQKRTVIRGDSILRGNKFIFPSLFCQGGASLVSFKQAISFQVPFGWWHWCCWCYVSWCRHDSLRSLGDALKSLKWPSTRHLRFESWKDSQKPLWNTGVVTVEGALLNNIVVGITCRLYMS